MKLGWVCFLRKNILEPWNETLKSRTAVGEKKYVHTNGITSELLYFSHTQSFLHWQVSDIHAIGFYWHHFIHQHLGGQWQPHAGASKKQHLRITWDSSHKVYHRQGSNPLGSVIPFIFCAEQSITGCDVPALPGTGGGHSVHMCFFSSRNAHQALPFALVRAAHILLLAHWSSQSLDCKKITNNGFAVFCFTTL